jgi:hypothetical protein
MRTVGNQAQKGISVMSNGNKKTSIAEFQTVINALEDYPAKTFPLGGKIWKSSDLASAFQAAIDAINAGSADKITWQASVAKEQTTKALALSLFGALKGYIAVADGKKSDAFKTFGFASTPVAPTPATKVAAVEKRAATRKARGTLGKRQRQAITGVVAPASAPAPVASQPASGNASGGNGSNGAH